MGVCSSSKKSLRKYASEGDKNNKYVQDKDDCATYEKIPKLHEGPIKCIRSAWGSNEEFISVDDNAKVVWYNWKKDEIVNEWKTHNRSINCVAYGMQTKCLYTCSRDLTIHRIEKDIASPTQILTGHQLTISAIDINETDTMLCSGGRDTLVAIWDVVTGQKILFNKTPLNLVTCMKWINNQNICAQGSEDLTLRLWDVRSSPIRPIQIMQGYTYFPLAMDISSDQNYIFTSSKGFNGVGCEGRLWDRRKGQCVYEFYGHQQDATCCTFLSNISNIVLTASKDCTIKIWNTFTGKMVYDHSQIGCGMFTSIDDAPNSNIVYASSFESQLYVYRIEQDGQGITLVNSTHQSQK